MMLFDTLTESLIYGITGVFPTGSFTQVVQVGSGMTGFLNVSVNTIIRLIILLFHSKIDADQLSLYIYMSVLIILAGLAIFMFAYRLIDIPSVTIRMNQQMVSFKRENPGDIVELHLVENELSFWELTKKF
ncbi:unnamed protein product [Rotaria sp. Silwood1]|nr:unnamed protein product [Rotaria sp. Silwood1]